MSDCPKCDQCGLEVTTALMPVYCPQATTCEFWPHSEGKEATVSQGAELFTAKLWIDNALKQIDMQIQERKRLAAALAKVREVADFPKGHDGALDDLYGRLECIYLHADAALGNAPAAERKLVGDWTRADVEDLRERLTESHVSALLSPEKLPKKDWYEAAGFVRTACVDAHQLLDAVLEQFAAGSK